MAYTPIRNVNLGSVDATIEHRSDGSFIVRNPHPLSSYPRFITERLDHWAVTAPDRIWFAERAPDGGWNTLTYGEGRARVRRIAAALLALGLNVERPVAILSGNSISHALLAYASLYAGIPYAAIAPAYSTISTDFAKLRAVIALLTPGLVFAASPGPFMRAIDSVIAPDVTLVVDGERPPGHRADTLATIEASGRTGGASLDAARAKMNPDDIAKFLFTSGSTGVPKAVINTHRMLAANAVQITDHFAFFRDEPPIVVDWAPWNHTAGGNHDVNLVLYNGGTFYIDDGKPTPSGIGATVRTLKEISPTWYFNVPKGYSALLPYLRSDAQLRENFFKRLHMMWYAGAGMARYVWDGLDEVSILATGERIVILTGLGATETAPFALAADRTMVDAGLVGLPARSVDLKLVPTGGKLEARIRGPNVTPGYWRQPDLTAAAFDEEGFYRLGDALRFADPADISKGLYFDGRVAEDFKLATGTWVTVGPLRSAFVDHCAPFVQDVVLAGLDRDSIGALIFLDIEHCRMAAGKPSAPLAELAVDPAIRGLFADRLATFAATATGSSNRVDRIALVADSPSIDSAELTDKGSVNQRAVLANRKALVDALYGTAELPNLIRL